MLHLISAPPVTEAEPVCEVLHGSEVADPYRWLEDQNSPRTRAWIEEQTRYARSYLDNIPGREKIRERIREFLAVETYDSLMKAAGRYFFRKRLAEQEQPCIYMREGAEGKDQLLVDPFELGRGIDTAVKLLRISPEGRLLLYEIKNGGERTGSFAVFDADARRTLPEQLPRGYLRGFAFTPDGKGFYYVHETVDREASRHPAALLHIFGSNFADDREIFRAEVGPQVRLALTADRTRIGFLVYRYGAQTRTDFHIKTFGSAEPAACVVADADYFFAPVFVDGKILALTDRNAPNFQIAELRKRDDGSHEWSSVIPETSARIRQWLVVGHRIFLSRLDRGRIEILVFALDGTPMGGFGPLADETIRLAGAAAGGDEIFLESESFTRPIAIDRYSPENGKLTRWMERDIPCRLANFAHTQAWYRSKDGASVPMFLVGRPDVLCEGSHPTIMTSYGGYGVPVTSQFSVFAALLIERGCLFALPRIRGGSEFGTEWYEAARRSNRQKAYDDFLCAADWLIETGRTSSESLAIFGGSNSGLLVGAAMTQRPEIFRVVLCMVPLLDMLRYHLFDGADIWRNEFGTSEDAEDFKALARYSPYHRVRDGVAYPATMIVSGDADQNCNPLHARKMTARLQAANVSDRPILLDYSRSRGHSPVLPLSRRIDALTDRIAFVAGQLELPV